MHVRGIYLTEETAVDVGGAEICKARLKIVTRDAENNKVITTQVARLDTCGAVTLVHSDFLRDVQPC